MTDKEKVIKGLECRKNAKMRCGNPCEETGNCKYATLIRDPSGEPYYPYICDRKKLCEDALALIREQQEQLKAHEWRKFEFREPNAEEKASHPDWVWVLVNAPYEGEEILVSDGKYGWKDEFCNNGDECYLDSGHEMERCWWMPLPELPKEDD